MCSIPALLLSAFGGLLAACSQAAPPAATQPPAPTSPPAPARPASTSAPAAAGAAISAPAANPGTSSKATAVIAQSQDIIALDPTQHTTYPTQNVLWHMYEPLVARGPVPVRSKTNGIIPDLGYFYH